MKPGWSIAPGPPLAPQNGAALYQTPSQAKHGLEGVFVLQPQVPNSRKSSP
jgi:hypothetical protein